MAQPYEGVDKIEQGPVLRHARNLREQIDKSDALISDLIGKLKPIRASLPEDDNTKGELSEASSSELGGDLSDLVMKVRLQQARLIRLIAEVEL